MYKKPIKFRGTFVVTTPAGRTITTGDAIEAIEWIAEKGRDRSIWQWYNGRYILRGR